MPKLNGLTPSKINTITLGTAVITGEWADRPGTGDDSLTANDGDFFRVKVGTELYATYRYSSTIGEWVRPEIYEGSPSLKTRIRGSVLPSAEDEAWTHVTSNGGTVTTDGTKVTFNGGSAANKTAYAYYNHGYSSHKFHFIQGLVQCTEAGTPASIRIGRSIGMDVNGRFINVALRTDDLTASFHNYSRYGKNQNNWPYTQAGTNLPSSSFPNFADCSTKEVLLELYGNDSGSWCYISHSVTPVMAVMHSRVGTTSYTNYAVGDIDGGEIGTVTLRESFWGTYTPTANTASALYQYFGGT